MDVEKRSERDKLLNMHRMWSRPLRYRAAAERVIAVAKSSVQMHQRAITSVYWTRFKFAIHVGALRQQGVRWCVTPTA